MHRVPDWPDEVAEPLRRTARGQAMWEMRHRHLMSEVLRDLAEAGIRALLLKGTALAYDLYSEPSERSRGDSDLLITPPDVQSARDILMKRGFAPSAGDPLELESVRLQEAWSRSTPDGLTHVIDLHWQTLNSVALAPVMPFETAWAGALPLPRFSPKAWGLPREFALLLACAHRAQHVLNPYYVADQTYFDGDRLIWLCDIDRLSRALDADVWDRFVAAVLGGGLAAVVLDGLVATRMRLGTPLSETVLDRLRSAPQDTPEARYLLAGHRVTRIWHDLGAVPGLWAKLRYLRMRLLPPGDFMRAKYPGLVRQPLPLLHLRRITELLNLRRRQ